MSDCLSSSSESGQERHWGTWESPEKGSGAREDSRVLWGGAKGTVGVYPGEKEAQDRPYHSLQLPDRGSI